MFFVFNLSSRSLKIFPNSFQLRLFTYHYLNYCILPHNRSIFGSLFGNLKFFSSTWKPQSEVFKNSKLWCHFIRIEQVWQWKGVNILPMKWGYNSPYFLTPFQKFKSLKFFVGYFLWTEYKIIHQIFLIWRQHLIN